MHILYAFPEPLPLERARGLQAVHTVAALAQAGMEIDLAFVPVAGTDPFDDYGVARPAGVRLIPVARALGWPLSRMHSNRLFFANLQRQCRNAIVNAVMVRHLKLAALIARGWPQTPLLYEAHEVFGDTAAPAKREANRALERLIMAEAQAVVANSNATARQLRERYAPAGILEVIANGVEPLAALPEKPWHDAGQHIVYAGSFFPWKGASELVAAAGELRGCRLQLIGGDETRIAELRAQCVPGGAEVLFCGRLPHSEVMRRLGATCIAVLPNRDDTDSAFTSPIKLFEYMAAGCAIVTSDLPAIREILGPEDAVWVRPGDASALAAGIRRLTEDVAYAQMLGRRALAKSAGYSWAARGHKLAEVLRRIGGSA